MNKAELTEQIRLVTSQISEASEKKALDVAAQAKAAAAEVSSIAIAKALDVSTLAAQKAAEAAAAAASVATTINVDISYIKKDIVDMKSDVKSINEKLDSKYVRVEDYAITKVTQTELTNRVTILEQYRDQKLGNSTGVSTTITWIFLSIGSLVGIITVVLRLLGK